MAKTMKDFISEKQEREAYRAQIAEKVTNLAADVAAFTAEAEAEAAKGNVEGYSSFKGKAERAQIEAHVAQAQLKAVDAPFPVDDVRAAWAKYAEDYNKALARDLKEYEKRKEELATLFRKMIALQNGALNMRKLAAEYAGKAPQGFSPTDEEYRAFPMNYLPADMGKQNREMEFFARNNSEQMYLGAIINSHRPQ